MTDNTGSDLQAAGGGGGAPPPPPQKKPRRGIGSVIMRTFWRACALFALFIILIAVSPVANYLASTLIVEPDVKDSDLIVVLGGGAYRNGTLSSLSNERLIRGLRLFSAGHAPKLFFAGGTIKDPVKKLVHTIKGKESEGSVDIVEASIMRDIAIELGMPRSALIVDLESTNTSENMEAVKKLIDKEGLGSALVVTSPTHMYRVMRVCAEIELKCNPAPVADYTAEITSSVGRLSLFRRVVVEYSSIVLYTLLAYI